MVMWGCGRVQGSGPCGGCSVDAPMGCYATGFWPGWVWPGPVSAGEEGGWAACRNLPEQCPVGEVWAGPLGSLGLAKGKVFMAILGERSWNK